MPKFDYVRAGSVGEAIALLNDPAYTTKPLAGGTDVLVYLHHRQQPYSRLVDISLLPELELIQQDGDVITLVSWMVC